MYFFLKFHFEKGRIILLNNLLLPDFIHSYAENDFPLMVDVILSSI